MSWLLMLVLIFLMQVFIKQSYPIRMAAVVLIFSLISTMILTVYIGPMMGICSFMVLVGGVLVVFGYSVALVPFSGDSQNESSNYSFMKKVMKMVLMLIGWVLCLSQVELNLSLPYFFINCLYFSEWWSKMVVFLGLYLLFAMIAAVSICSSYKGALVQ